LFSNIGNQKLNGPSLMNDTSDVERKKFWTKKTHHSMKRFWSSNLVTLVNQKSTTSSCIDNFCFCLSINKNGRISPSLMNDTSDVERTSVLGFKFTKCFDLQRFVFLIVVKLTEEIMFN
jgi:hypothetical protein